MSEETALEFEARKRERSRIVAELRTCNCNDCGGLANQLEEDFNWPPFPPNGHELPQD